MGWRRVWIGGWRMWVGGWRRVWVGGWRRVWVEEGGVGQVEKCRSWRVGERVEFGEGKEKIVSVATYI